MKGQHDRRRQIVLALLKAGDVHPHPGPTQRRNRKSRGLSSKPGEDAWLQAWSKPKAQRMAEAEMARQAHTLNKHFHIKQSDITSTTGFKKRPAVGEAFRIISGNVNGSLFGHSGGEGAVDKSKVELWSDKYRDIGSYQKQIRAQVLMG